jgi:hypothetical protein
MAMQEALSRVCYTYLEDIPAGSSFRFFGRRYHEGHPVRTNGDRSQMLLVHTQLEDMECHLHDVQEMLRMETVENGYATMVIN